MRVEQIRSLEAVTGVECATYTVEQAGARLGLGRFAAYEAVRRGDIPSVRIGRRVLVPRAALERMLAAEPEPAAAR